MQTFEEQQTFQSVLHSDSGFPKFYGQNQKPH